MARMLLQTLVSPALLLLFAAILLLGAAEDAAGQEEEAEAAGEPGAHDPVLIKEGDTYHLFATGRGVTTRSSKDLKAWSRPRRVFEETPKWVLEILPDFDGNIWAPDIFEHDGTFYLYYSVSAFGRNNSAIGVATTSTLDPDSPDYGWTDHGMVVQSVPGRDMWNAIDAQLIRADDGTFWMTFGSHWNGIKLVKMADDLLEVATPQTWHTIAARHRYWKLDERDAGDAANPELNYAEKYPAQVQDAALASQNGSIEAPTLFRKDGWYYLFVSWDRCCRGLESTYKVVAGRSRDIEGPYVDRADQNMLWGGGSLVTLGFSESDRWAAGGHCDVVTFDGTDYLVLHAYGKQDQGRPKLVIKPIQWDEFGWPTVSMRK